MVYSSAPLYLDPHNWNHHQEQTQFHRHQQENQRVPFQAVVTHGGGGGGENPHHHQVAVHTPPPVPSQVIGGKSSSSIRPGSMADRAKQAKIPQPELGLKCPRCESTNTKFCYFNNYSLTQPRHFCKMCRRYWTRGGALRSVPVGGGCRRNKRSGKSGVSKSSCSGEPQTRTGPCNNSSSPISSNSNSTEMNNVNSSHGRMLETSLPSQGFGTRLSQFPLLASLQGLTQGQYGSQASTLGHNFGEMMNTAVQGELGFQIGPSSGRSSDLWRPHHFPNFLAGFDPSQQFPHPPPSSSLYQLPIDHQGMDQAANNQVPSRSLIISAMSEQSVRPSMLSNGSANYKNNDAAAVKAEGVNQGGTNLLSSSFLGMPENSQYWVGNNNNSNSTWKDLSNLNSSTNNLK